MSKKGKSWNFWELGENTCGNFWEFQKKSNFEGELPLEFVGIFGNLKDRLRIVHGCVMIWNFSLHVHMFT